MATVAARLGVARPVHPSCKQHSKPISAPAHCQGVRPWRVLAAPAAATSHDSMAATIDWVEPKKHKKMKLPKPAKDALYLLTWGEAAGHAGQDVQGLRNDLKVLEKVSKEAVWFSVKEGQAGGKWVLVVTQDAKHARKYGLTELKGDVEQISLAGLDEPVTIPVAALKEAVMKAMDEDSSDSSSDEEEGMMAPAQKRPQAAATQLPAGLAEEDPAAALQAAALLGGSTTMPTTKEGRRKLGDAVKDLRRPAAQQTVMDAEDESSSSSSSSSGSESDECEEAGGSMAVIKPTQLETAQGKPAMVEAGEKMEEGELSSDSSSESECDEEEVKADMKKMDKAMKKSEKKRAKEEKQHRKLRGGESGELMEGSDYC